MISLILPYGVYIIKIIRKTDHEIHEIKISRQYRNKKAVRLVYMVKTKTKKAKKRNIPQRSTNLKLKD